MLITGAGPPKCGKSRRRTLTKTVHSSVLKRTDMGRGGGLACLWYILGLPARLEKDQLAALPPSISKRPKLEDYGPTPLPPLPDIHLGGGEKKRISLNNVLSTNSNPHLLFTHCSDVEKELRDLLLKVAPGVPRSPAIRGPLAVSAALGLGRAVLAGVLRRTRGAGSLPGGRTAALRVLRLPAIARSGVPAALGLRSAALAGVLWRLLVAKPALPRRRRGPRPAALRILRLLAIPLTALPVTATLTLIPARAARVLRRVLHAEAIGRRRGGQGRALRRLRGHAILRLPIGATAIVFVAEDAAVTSVHLRVLRALSLLLRRAGGRSRSGGRRAGSRAAIRILLRLAVLGATAVAPTKGA